MRTPSNTLLENHLRPKYARRHEVPTENVPTRPEANLNHGDTELDEAPETLYRDALRLAEADQTDTC
jgi:hypothetical protein